MGIIIVQDTLPGFPHTPFRPVDERFLLFDILQFGLTRKECVHLFRIFIIFRQTELLIDFLDRKSVV